MAEFLEGIEGYDEVEVTEFGDKPEEIKPGAYILKITKAKIERYSADAVAVKLAFDVVEGEFKGYYAKLYEYNKSGQYAKDAKWKGTYSIFYPTSSDPEKKKQQTASFKRAITAINDSNTQKIDPTKKFSLDVFNGKIVGGAFGTVDHEWNGNNWTRCECRWLVSADKVRKGEVETPKHKGLKGASVPAQTAQTDTTFSGSSTDDFEEIISDGEVPF